MKTRIITFNPWLYADLGHSLIYTQAIEKAAKLNGWDYIAALPKRSLIENLPRHWSKSIGCPTVRHWFEKVEGRPYRRPKKRIRAKQRVQYYYSAFQFLKNYLRDSSAQTVLFLEAFAQTDVGLLANLLRFLPKKRLSIWLVHRYQSEKLGRDVEKYKKCHSKIIEMGVDLRLLTDSDLLKEDLEPVFEMPLTVLPIHYIEKLGEGAKNHAGELICWWPGVIREGKGLKIIEAFASSKSECNQRVRLVLNQKCNLSLNEKSPHITYLEDHLSREDYQSWMKKSDVILLPYNDPHYKRATSSIFIEATMAGKVPLVYPNTWMAYELKKYDLGELVIDWKADDLARTILSLSSSEAILGKLAKMKKGYESFHTLGGYSKVMQALVGT